MTVFGIIPWIPACFAQALEISIIRYVVTLCILIMNVVNDLFGERIEPNNGNAKFADVWPCDSI